jgi:hypothetical protein
MTSTLTALAIAVSGTSLICFLLMARAERRRNKPKTPSDGGGSDGSTFAGGDDGSHFWGWFGGDHSASDSSGIPAEAIASVPATAGVAATTAVVTAAAAIDDMRLAIGNPA